MRNSHGNSLGGVDRAPSAHCQDEIELLFPAETDALTDEAEPRIRLHSPQLDVLESRFLQGPADAVVEAGFLDAASAVVQEDPPGVLRRLFPRRRLRAFPEDDPRRVLKNEV